MYQENKENGIEICICQRTAALIIKYLFLEAKLLQNYALNIFPKYCKKSKLNIEINSHSLKVER